MDSRTPERSPSPDAVEFVRFCYHRRKVGWPELYDEMCAVAGRGLYRGWGSDELSAEGIGFSLFEMPALATLVQRVIADEHARRTPVATAAARVALASGATAHAPDVTPATASTSEPAADPAPGPSLRFAGVGA